MTASSEFNPKGRRPRLLLEAIYRRLLQFAASDPANSDDIASSTALVLVSAHLLQ